MHILTEPIIITNTRISLFEGPYHSENLAAAM